MRQLDVILQASISFPLGAEVDVIELPKIDSAIGIDVGLERFRYSF